MKSIRIQSWEQFVAHTSELDGWAFRGQPTLGLPLLSLLSRRLMAFCPEQPIWPLREARAMRVFRRKAHVHIAHPAALDDDLRCMAMMQHHGAPTRLLDFTKSPFVAAFFALEGAKADSAVYALNTPELWDRAPSFDPQLKRDVVDPRLAGNFERYFLPNQHPLVWFGEPSEMDTRLMAQSGLFVLPGRLDQPLDELLASYDADPNRLLVQLQLPQTLRKDAMRALYRMNITHATLWPDMDGLARSMNQELEIIWPRLEDEFRTQNHRASDE